MKMKKSSDEKKERNRRLRRSGRTSSVYVTGRNADMICTRLPIQLL